MFNIALELLPEKLRCAAGKYASCVVEELRLRLGKKPSLLIGGREIEFYQDQVSSSQLELIMEKATEASVHAVLPQLREGYVNYKGLRLGVCGRLTEKDGTLSCYQSFSSLCIRIPSVFVGNCDVVYNTVSRPIFSSTLILSPPGGGKTTLLREFIRRLADSGVRVGLIDERGELCGFDDERGALFDTGRCCDVLSGVDKYRGTMMLIRGMNPQVLAVDEITRPEDTQVLINAAGCGVELLATAHCTSADDLKKRPLYRRLLREKIFSQAVEIICENGERKYKCLSLQK